MEYAVLSPVPRIPTPAPAWDGSNPDPAKSYAPYRLCNIGNKNPVELLAFIKILEAQISKRANLNFLPLQSDDVPATSADVYDLVVDAGFAPSTPLKEGIADLSTGTVTISSAVSMMGKVDKIVADFHRRSVNFRDVRILEVKSTDHLHVEIDAFCAGFIPQAVAKFWENISSGWHPAIAA